MIFRDKHDGEFFQMSNSTIQDKELSLSARGLLAYMLSLPDEWRFSRNSLSSATGATVSEIRKLLIELTDAGYIKLVKDSHGRGNIKSRLDLYETKITNGENIASRKYRQSKKSPVEKSPVENIASRNSRHYIKDFNSNNTLENKNLKDKDLFSISVNKHIEVEDAFFADIERIKKGDFNK